jgi:transposase
MIEFNQEFSVFQSALKIEEPWYVIDYELNQKDQVLDVYLDFKRGAKFACPHCGNANAKVHDIVDDNRTWRHLNFWQYTTYLHARHPRVKCDMCGKIRAVIVDWSRQSSGFTWFFEAEVMELMKEMPVAAVARKVGEHDTRLWRVFHYYVDRAMNQLDFSKTSRMAIDETSSKRGHEYVTLFVDIDTKKVMFATEGKGSQVLKDFSTFLQGKEIDPKNIKEVCSDMSPAFIKGVETEFPKANITFDKFHVMKLVNEALDQVRRQEQNEQPILKKTRYIWLKNQDNLTTDQQEIVLKLKDTNLKTARAYRIRISLQEMWTKSTLYSRFYFNEWYNWAIRSKLDPIIKVAKTLRKHEEGILRWFETKMTNGLLEGINSLVQAAKRKARGYRSTKNFIAMIYATANKLSIRVEPHRLG